MVPLVYSLVFLAPTGSPATQLVPSAGLTRADDEKIALTEAGKKLAETLDALDVENHWKAGEHVTDWKTGETDGKTGGPATHCSLFVAAACRKVGASMLEPPPQSFLSNRQQDWLLQEGKEKGWRRVDDPVEAQRLANRGVVVVASCKNPNAKKAGHIAVVRPAEVGPDEIKERGPRIAQAGAVNYRDTDVKTGFKHHPGAWEKGEVLFFAYQPEE